MDIALNCFLNPSGLSWVAQEFFKCFSDFGLRTIPVWILPPEMETRDSLDPTLAQDMLTAANKPLEDAPVQIHAGRADEIRALKSRTAVMASIVLEGNRLTPTHCRTFKDLDAILVPSYFCRNVCLSSGVPRDKVFNLPYPLDLKTWNMDVKPLLPAGERFRFLFMNTWYERKGWDLMLRAFWEEFSASDPVELVIKSYKENDRTEPVDISIARYAAKLGVNRNSRAPVTVIDHLLPAKVLPQFMKSFDAYVSPHRSEGFGLNIWYAMAVGTPVVCTDYGGNTDFTKSDTAWLVRPERMSKPSASETAIFPHLSDTTWAEPNITELRSQMRMCYRYRDESARRAKNGSALVSEAYCYRKIMSALEGILDQVSPGAWEKLCMSRAVEHIAKQPSERFEPGKPISMLEI